MQVGIKNNANNELINGFNLSITCYSMEIVLFGNTLNVFKHYFIRKQYIHIMVHTNST